MNITGEKHSRLLHR